MKKIFTLAFVLATTLLFGQLKDKKIYLDSLSRETKIGNHKYYRITTDYHLNKELYEVTDFYLDDIIKSQRTYEDKDGFKPIGIHKEYYPSGKLKSQENYSQNHELVGAFYSLYENGNKETEGEFVKIKIAVDKEHITKKINSYWDENGTQKVIEGVGSMIEKKEFENSRGKITNGLKDGMWVGFNAQYKIQFADKYEVGIFKGGVSKDTNNTEFGYLEIEKQPEFKPGWQEFGKFVGRNFRIPDVNKNVKGRVVLGFIIGSEGQVQNVEIVRSLEKSFDKEAVRMINNTSNVGLWIPGEYRGKKVDSKYMLPIMLDIKND